MIKKGKITGEREKKGEKVERDIGKIETGNV